MKESHVDPYRVARSANRSLHDGIDAKLARELGERPSRFLSHGPGSTRHHSERADLRQIPGQAIGHSVAEVRAIRAAREVLEWKYRDRSDGAVGVTSHRPSRHKPPRSRGQHNDA